MYEAVVWLLGQLPRLRKTKLIVISEIPDFGGLNTYESNCPISRGKIRENEKL